MKCCSRPKFLRKMTNLDTWTHFGEVRGDTWPWMIASWKAHGQLSIRVYCTFLLSIMIPELRGKMCTIQLFSQGGRPLCTQILHGQGSLTAILGFRKLDTGLHNGEPASLYVLSFWNNTGMWWKDKRTDRWICRSIYNARKANFGMLWKETLYALEMWAFPLEKSHITRTVVSVLAVTS